MASHNQSQQHQSSTTSSSSSSSHSSSKLLFLSSSLLLLLVSLQLVAVVVEPPIQAQAAPQVFNIKQRSAIQALRNLDNQYMAQNRPRFGKRFSSAGGEQVGYFNEALAGAGGVGASAESLGASTKPVLSSPGAIIGDKWVLVNRARPLSKAAQAIFREMLSDSERYHSSSSGAAEEIE